MSLLRSYLRSRRRRVNCIMIDPITKAERNFVHIFLFLPVPVVHSLLLYRPLHALSLLFCCITCLLLDIFSVIMAGSKTEVETTMEIS